MVDEERLQRIKVKYFCVHSCVFNIHRLAVSFNKNVNITAGAFLASIAGISAFAGFSFTLAAAKKADPKYFNKGLHNSAELTDAGVILALRALGWGTLYAIAGTSCLCYGIWKFSQAKDLKDFRVKVGNILPVIPKNSPPQSRTEFSGINDLLTYISKDYKKDNK